MRIKKIIMLLMILLVSLLWSNSVSAMSYYQTVGTTTGLVTATSLNVRQGPGTNYGKVTTINKNEYVRVFAQIKDWYVIQTENDYIGMVSKQYIKLVYPTKAETTNKPNTTESSINTTTGLTKDEQETLDLINAERKKAGLASLKIDSELQNVARTKAKDLVDNNYFAHNSPTYGTPFEMMKSFGIKYKTAGENIAGNSTNSGAVKAWMNSEGHRANILNSSYNYTGLAVVSSPKYGKVYVQMFIGK